MAAALPPAILSPMKSSEQSLALPLDYASELSFELHLMRGECSEAARKLMAHHPVDEKGLEDCAVLDDALAQAKRLLDCALDRVQRSRKKRTRRSR